MHEYRALLGRIKTQAYCMQLVLEDQRGSSSHQCNNIIQRLQYIYDDPNVHHLVKHCIVEIAQIINGNKKSKDYLMNGYNGQFNTGHWTKSCQILCC